MPEVVIREMKKADLGACLLTIREAWPGRAPLIYSRAEIELRKMFAYRYDSPRYLVAIRNREIVGLAGLIMSSADWDLSELLWVGVKPDVQRSGIGSMLVRRVLAMMPASSAGAFFSTNIPKFYLSLGATKIHAKGNTTFMAFWKDTQTAPDTEL